MAASPEPDTVTEYDNEILKQVIQSMFLGVTNAVTSYVISYLFQESVINSDNASTWTNTLPTDVNTGERLLHHLFKLDKPKAFIKLREALLKESEHLVKIIDSNYTLKLTELRSKQRMPSPSIPTSPNDKGEDGYLLVYARSSSRPQSEADQPYDDVPTSPLPQINQQRTKNMYIDDSSLSPSSHVYADNVLVSYNHLLEELETLKRRMNEHALIEKDIQYNIAVMSASKPPLSSKRKTNVKAWTSGGPPIRAVTGLEAALYVVREKCAEIECYDMSSGSFLDTIAVSTGLKDPRDMAACSRRLIIYIKDFDDTIHWVSVNGDGQTGKWPICEKSAGISVNSQNELLFTCPGSKRIRVMTHDGYLVRDINLGVHREPSFEHLHHAVELCTGQIVVSFGEQNDRESGVCILNANKGTVLRQYCVKNNVKSGKSFFPLRLAVCGYIFVADFQVRNGRILRLHPHLDKTEIIKVTAKGACLPLRFFIDERGRNIYIADNEVDPNTNRYTSGHITVVQLVEEKLLDDLGASPGYEGLNPYEPLPAVNLYEACSAVSDDQVYS